MLHGQNIIAFAATTQPERAAAFYRDVLGLTLQEDTPFALVFAAGRTMLRIQKVKAFTPHPFTALGWDVADIASTVQKLAGQAVMFKQIDFLGAAQDANGIWTAPNGDKVAWFADPDGNTLSLTQFVQSQ